MIIDIVIVNSVVAIEKNLGIRYAIAFGCMDVASKANGTTTLSTVGVRDDAGVALTSMLEQLVDETELAISYIRTYEIACIDGDVMVMKWVGSKMDVSECLGVVAAAKSRNTNAIKYILEFTVYDYLCLMEGAHVAVEHDNADYIEVVCKGEYGNKSYSHLLSMASKYGSVNVIKYMLDQDPSPLTIMASILSSITHGNVTCTALLLPHSVISVRRTISWIRTCSIKSNTSDIMLSMILTHYAEVLNGDSLITTIDKETNNEQDDQQDT